MKRRYKAVLSALCALVIAMCPGMAAASAEETAAGRDPYVGPGDAVAATTNLPNSFLIGDSDGARVGWDGVYFINAVGVIPGDVITKRLTIQNLDMTGTNPESTIPYTLTMRAEPLFSVGPVDLLDEVHLELKLDGQIIYSGRVRGDEGVNMIEAPLRLGEYRPGDQKELDIKLTVGTDWELTYEESVAEFKWIFYAWREVSFVPPQTGIAEYAIVGLIGGTVLMWLVLILKKKKKQDEERAVLDQ